MRKPATPNPQTHDPVLIHLLTILRKRRKALGLSQLALGQNVARTQAWVSKIEKGQQLMNILEFFRVCGALELPPERLIKSLRHSLGFPSKRK